MSDNAFERFNNTTAEIAVLGAYDDYENLYDIEIKGSISGDLQPYSGMLAEKDYGLKADCQYQFFCGVNDNIKAGAYLLIGGKSYLAVYTADFGMGMEVLLMEAEINGKRE